MSKRVRKDQIGALLFDRIASRASKPFVYAPEGISGVSTARRNVAGAVLEHIHDCMKVATVIQVQNVFDYYHEQEDKDWLIEKDFPNLAPPYQSMWFECATDRLGHGMVKVGVMLNSIQLESIEELCHFVDTEAQPKGYAHIRRVPPYKDSLIPGTWEESKFFWHTLAHVVVEIEKGKYAPIAYTGWGCNDQGQVLSKRLSVVNLGSSVADNQQQEVCNRIIATLIFPMFMAITFMHCKNVKVLPRAREDQKFAKVWARDHREPLVEFNEITIEPVQKVLEGEGQIQRIGLKKALHKVRGHFAEYGPQYGKGLLFGRTEGKFFIPQHARGDSALGTINQQYKVRPESNAGENLPQQKDG